MDVEGDGGDFERSVLHLARPDERGIEVRVVGVSFFTVVMVCVGGYKTDGRVVAPFFTFVVVLFDGLLFGFGDFGHSDYLYYYRYLLNLFSFII